MSFLVTAFVSSSFCPAEDSSATVIRTDYRDTGYFVTVTSPDSVAISVDGTPTGQEAVSDASVVNVVTNAPLGYKLYISASSANLTSSGITQSFAPVSSTTLTVNTWGFSLDTGSTKSWQAVPQVTNPGSMEEDAIISAGATKISELATPNYPTGTDIPVYYGVNADTNMLTGTYSTTVTYTAFGEGIPPEVAYMQDFTVAECTAMDDGEDITLVDSRDDKEYRVTKMKDGHCWMTENLKLGSTTGTMQLTSADSNVSANITLPQVLSSGSSNRTSMQVWANTGTYDGYYYNWCAAVAYGAVDGGTGNCDGVTTEQTNSVCPKGWRLPTNSGDYSFSNLFGKYGLPTSNVSENHISEVEASPLSFTRAGYYNSGYRNQGSRGAYWSRTPYSSANAYNFLYGSSYFYPQDYNSKNYGFSVRCVLGS